MYSNLSCCLAFLLVLTSCGAPLDDPKAKSEPPAITFYSEASSSGMQIDADHVMFLDNRIDFLLRFRIEPFKLEDGVPLALNRNELQWFLPASKGRFYVTIGKDDFAIVNNRGLRTKNPVKFDHKIQAAALSSTHDYLFLQDELGKIALLGLNKDGEIEARFIGLPTLGTDKTLVSGTMLNDGRFISSLGESTIALIDLGLTLQKEEWQIKTFEITDAYAMTWFAEIPGGVGQVLIKDSGRIILLDYEAGSIIDEVSIAQMHDIRGSRLGIPHLMATDQLQNENAATGSYHLYYVQNGKISHQILTNVRSSFSSTYLDKERFRLIIAAEERDDDGSSRKQKKETKFKGDVFRFDLKNGSKVEKVTLKNQNRVALTDQFVIQYLDSALGWAKRFKYSDSDSDIFTELKFFNLDLLREKYD